MESLTASSSNLFEAIINKDIGSFNDILSLKVSNKEVVESLRRRDCYGFTPPTLTAQLSYNNFDAYEPFIRAILGSHNEVCAD